ncbi:MAG: TrkA family potassium uptake protein [Clostridiales bacterium]|nr:TrkA family potassium uptake protein [Clostridiales bacterium]
MFNKKSIEYGIIGLGRFGTALAEALAGAGKELIVIDENENKIKGIRNLIENAFVVKSLDKETLEEVGLQNCDTVIVCIGQAIDVSILTTLNVISMGIPRVISKATSYEQGQVLEKLGAEVIYPEHDMAIRLANKILSSSILESIELRNDIVVSELMLTKKIAGKSILESNIRNKFRLNIIAIEQNGFASVEITPSTILYEHDKIVVVGKKDDISNFQNYLLDK